MAGVQVEEVDQQSSGTGRLPRYLAAAALVRLADEGARVGLVLLALERTGNAGTGGLLIAALLLPHVAAAPGVGWLTDRARRPKVVVVAAALGFATSLAATALLLGRVPLPMVVVILLLGGCAGPALTGGLTSQLSTLVGAERVPRAYGADSLTYNVAGIAGPAVAGALAAVGGAAAATITLAAAAGAGALVLLTVPFVTRAGAADGRPAPGLTAGARAILTDRVLGTVTVASGLGQLGPGALAVTAAVLADRSGQPAATGWLLTSVAVGGLFGSLWWTWRPVAPPHAPRTVMAALLGIGVPLALAAATSTSLGLTAALFALSGLFLGPFTGALFTTRQQHAPADAQAQVFSLSAGFKTSAAAAGAGLGGALAGLPVGHQLVLIGASPLLAGALGGVALAALRHRSKE